MSIMLYIVVSFIIMSLQLSAADVSLDIKQKIVSEWFEGEYAEALGGIFFASKTFVEDISSNIYNMEHCKQ